MQPHEGESFARYELRVNGDSRGDHPSLFDVFTILDDEFSRLPDPYADELTYWIEDYGFPVNGVPLRVVTDTMAGGLWQACCEDASVFETWLKIVGWMPTKRL